MTDPKHLKALYIVKQHIYFEIDAVLFNFLLIKES